MSMGNPIELHVDARGFRLDRYVSDYLPDLSRAAVQRLIDVGQIRVDGVARKASYHVQVGETVTVHVPPPEPATPRAESIPLDILYEDADLIVVNKPAGMVVHPAAGHAAGTLVNAVLGHLNRRDVGGDASARGEFSPPSNSTLPRTEASYVERPGIVHRLDSDTSGIIIVAKNDAAMRDLQAQFKSRRVHKTYLALVEGHVKPSRGQIDAPIGRDPKHRQKMAVLTRGKTRASVTVYRTLATLNGYTLVQAEPQTGRTHQIRVHLAFLGFPVVADAIYGKKTRLKNAGQDNALGLTRQFLHAWKIAFTLPRVGRAVSFTAPLPEDLRAVLEELGFEAHALR